MPWTQESKDKMIASRLANKKAKAKGAPPKQGPDVSSAILYLKHATRDFADKPLRSLSGMEMNVWLALRALTQKS
jgi:hypothetical protein